MRKILMFLCVVIVISLCIFANFCKYEANQITENNLDCITYNEELYVFWNDIEDRYYDSEVLYGKRYNKEMFPYSLVEDDLSGKVYTFTSFLDYIIPSNRYFSFCGDSKDFIIFMPNDSSVNSLYVKENFVFPNIDKNEVDEIWMCDSTLDYGYITDEKTVDIIVDCAKNGNELERDIYKYLVENSWDNRRIYMKYKGYPLVQEYLVSETKEGRYIVEPSYVDFLAEESNITDEYNTADGSMIDKK